MSWSPADDYDDDGRYNPGPGLWPRYQSRRRRECQPGCCWPARPLCDPPEPDEGDTDAVD